VELGRGLQADAVITGTIYRFRQRVGASMAATTPASVSFAIEFIRVSDGRVLWSRAYDETQRSLDQNLFKLGRFLKKGGKWLTAEELAVFGLKEVMASFPVP
jgi:TolB-like protein